MDQTPADGETVSSEATAVLVSEKLADFVPVGVTKIITAQPRSAYIQIATSFLEQRTIGNAYKDLGAASVAETAEVHNTAIVSDGVEIGENTRIGPNVVLGPGVRIGRDCVIGPGVVIESALIGNSVRVKANSVLGGSGFGLVPTGNGLTPMPHYGRVIIQDMVSLGSCVCVDRGAFDDTIVGEGTHIDNHVQIGHNVQIGRHCVIAAFGGLSGSVIIEDGVQMGGRVGIADHVRIGCGARLAADSAIMRDIPAGETWGGSPAKPFRQWMKESAWLTRAVKTRVKNIGGKDE